MNQVVETYASDNKEWFPERHKSIKRTGPLLLFGLLIFIAYLYFFVDISELVTIFQEINVFYYLLALLGVLLNLLTYSLTWQLLLRPLSINVSFKMTLLISWVGNFVEFFVPSESIGEDVSKSYLMVKQSGENTGKVVASVLGQRIISLIVTLAILIVCSLTLFILTYEIPASVSFLIFVVSIGTAIPLIFILLLCVRKQLSHRFIDILLRFGVFISRGRLNLSSLRSKAKNALDSFYQSIEILRKNPRNLVPPLFFSLVSYFFSVLVSYFVFISLGYPVSFVLLTIVYSLSRSLQSIPTMLPGEVGFFEVVMTQLYLALLGPQFAAISAAATVLTRILWLGFRLSLGFISLQWLRHIGLL
ncbi:flippase-like domain-containing protein [Candidatus Bathyarchaeota archaeon]|nr:flippase-like domain-containing protein [Candidatus Bathyarchaeota archaeon]